MKKKLVITALVITMMLSLTLATNVVFAGNKNQNDETNGNSVERGTGKLNGLNGCRAYGGTTAVFLGMFNPFTEQPGPWVVEGGACCASNKEAATSPTTGGTTYYEPVQCCNPPDYLPTPPFVPETPTGEQVPGNHCLCFAIRDYTVVP